MNIVHNTVFIVNSVLIKILMSLLSLYLNIRMMMAGGGSMDDTVRSAWTP
jgi:hypothetical protein